jgi:N utilization substance protein B
MVFHEIYNFFIIKLCFYCIVSEKAFSLRPKIESYPMLSRRSIRVKVMQALYSQSRDKELKDGDIIKFYQASIKETIELFLLNLYLIIEVAKVSVEDEAKRISKYLPNEDDKLFKSTIYHNDIINGLISNKDLKKRFDFLKFSQSVDQDLIRQLYRGFSETEAYVEYWHNRSSRNDDMNILLEMYRFFRSNELFVEMADDRYYQWTSEKSVVIGSVKKVLKLDSFENDFIQTFYPDSDAVKDLGETLLNNCFKIDDYIEKYVIPILIKWDKERIAVIDMIFIKMCLAEVIFFETIPCNVALNEYLELAKEYSTEKSREFLNGVMDKVIKDLQEQGVIDKTF